MIFQERGNTIYSVRETGKLEWDDTKGHLKGHIKPSSLHFFLPFLSFSFTCLLFMYYVSPFLTRFVFVCEFVSVCLCFLCFSFLPFCKDSVFVFAS